MEGATIHSDPDILSGIPVFVGTRVPAKTLIDYLEGGHNGDEEFFVSLWFCTSSALCLLPSAQLTQQSRNHVTSILSRLSLRDRTQSALLASSFLSDLGDGTL